MIGFFLTNVEKMSIVTHAGERDPTPWHWGAELGRGDAEARGCVGRDRTGPAAVPSLLCHVAAVLVVAGVWLVVMQTGALAHASLATTSPRHGSTVPTPPSEVVLVFTEPIDPALVQVEARTGDGTPLAAAMSVSGGRSTLTYTVSLTPGRSPSVGASCRAWMAM